MTLNALTYTVRKSILISKIVTKILINVPNLLRVKFGPNLGDSAEGVRVRVRYSMLGKVIFRGAKLP